MSDRIRSMQIGVDEVLRLEGELAKSKAAHNVTRRLWAKDKADLAAMTAERDTLRARCSSCPNIIEAGTRLEKALVAVEKRHKVIEVLKHGNCPPKVDVPKCVASCQACKNNWITEQLK